ncbi:MAG: DNA alkylation repair protein [Terracidiphilus sp.]
MAGKKSSENAKEFCGAVEAALAQLADAAKAKGMRAYMRDKFLYLGITTPERRAGVKVLIRGFAPVEAAALKIVARALWQMEHREYQYVAADLLDRHQAAFSLEDLPWLLELAQSKPWWDTVDTFPKLVGGIVVRSGVKGRRAMDLAVKHESFWVRRIAMLHQLGMREKTDTARLFKYADGLAPEKEFFIRKAVGWALRDYAWHDWRAVEKYLKQAQARLSGLTFREASKNFAALKKGG